MGRDGENSRKPMGGAAAEVTAKLPAGWSVLRAKGLDVKLARCGPAYTESINNWYIVKSANGKPVILRQSLRLDGNQIQDAYELRLNDSLPKDDARDRDPGVSGCK